MYKKKQIVFVNQSAGYLMIDIIDAFKDEYEERILLTGFLNPRNKILDATVKVEKLIPYDRSSTFKRMFTWVGAFLKILFLIKFKYPKAHLFLVSNPPLTAWVPLFCKNSYDILIYDVYPDALVEFGYFKQDSWIIKKWENINRRMYAKARKISTITSGMKERIAKYVNKHKVNVVPIWTDNSFLKPIPKSENAFLKTHQIDNDFIKIFCHLYDGNNLLFEDTVKFFKKNDSFKDLKISHEKLIKKYKEENTKPMKLKLEKSISALLYLIQKVAGNNLSQDKRISYIIDLYTKEIRYFFI